MSGGCEPWKLLVSALVLAGSSYHFLHKYTQPRKSMAEEIAGLRQCPPGGCPECVEDKCPRPLTKEEMKELCETFKERDSKRRAELREKMEKDVAEKWKKKQVRFGYIKRDPKRPTTV